MNTSNHDFQIVNCDTDAVMFCKKNGDPFTEEEQQSLLKEVNSLLPELIQMDHDGYFRNVVIVKAKNYYLEDFKNKVTIKGSGLKMSMKEPALKEFGKKLLESIVNSADLVALYNSYVREIITLKDIKPWCSKKTVTASVLNPERTNEQRVLDAMGEADEEFQEGDKLHVYFDLEGNLKLAENWKNDHDPFKLIEKLWKTVKVFETVVDIKRFPKYHLKKQRVLLDNLTNLT